jgi:hypothetical protein
MFQTALNITAMFLALKSYLPSLLALMLSLSVSSCSGRFQRDWKTTAVAPVTTAPKNVAGSWQGTWKSEATGHQGTLKAVVSEVPEKENRYAFRYHATWSNLFSATFESEHMAKPQGRNFVLTGHHDLGFLFGGVYHYEGTATPSLLKCRYRSKLDHGVFELQRP